MDSDGDEDFVVEAPSTKKTKKTTKEDDKKKGKKKSVTKDDKPSVSPKRKTPKPKKKDEKEVKDAKKKPKPKAKKKKGDDDDDETPNGNTPIRGGDDDEDYEEKENVAPDELDDDEADLDDDETESKAKKEKKSAKPKNVSADGPKDADQRKIYEYMKKQNRPYSSQNVFDNLHGEVKKTACQKGLDALVDDGYLQAKDFGKSRVYLLNQQNIPQIDEEEMDKLKKNLTKSKQEFDSLKEEVKEMNQNLKNLTNQLTNTQVIEEIEKHKKLVEETKKKFEFFEGGNYQKISDEDIKLAEDNKKKFETEYKKRKRMCMEMIKMLAESMDQKLSILTETIGIETD